MTIKIKKLPGKRLPTRTIRKMASARREQEAAALRPTWAINPDTPERADVVERQAPFMDLKLEAHPLDGWRDGEPIPPIEKPAEAYGEHRVELPSGAIVSGDDGETIGGVLRFTPEQDAGARVEAETVFKFLAATGKLPLIVETTPVLGKAQIRGSENAYLSAMLIEHRARQNRARFMSDPEHVARHKEQKAIWKREHKEQWRASEHARRRARRADDYHCPFVVLDGEGVTYEPDSPHYKRETIDGVEYKSHRLFMMAAGGWSRKHSHATLQKLATGDTESIKREYAMFGTAPEPASQFRTVA